MTGSVYFVQAVDGGPIKIGFSENPLERLRALQMASPASLRLVALVPGSYADEAAVHAHLHAHRLHGEWFTDHEDVLDVLRAPLSTLPRAVALRRNIWDEARGAMLAVRDETTRALTLIDAKDFNGLTSCFLGLSGVVYEAAENIRTAEAA